MITQLLLRQPKFASSDHDIAAYALQACIILLGNV